MRYHHRLTAVCSVIATGSMLVVATLAGAQEQSVVVEPQAAPTIAAPATSEEVIPGPVVTTIAAPVHPAPPVVSHASHRARKLFRCQPQVQLVMVAKNPADCCLYEIPLCVPACCEGEPVVRDGRGLLGRGVVEYCWPCGFTARVIFRKHIGDVKIAYDA